MSYFISLFMSPCQINKRSVAALIGDFSSDPTQVASYVCKLSNVPQLSPNALATIFDNKVKFPTFFRGISALALSARSPVLLMRQFGYTSLALIATTGTFDQACVQEFSAEASKNGLQIVTSQIVTTGVSPCDPMTFQMAQLKSSKRRVFGLFALNADARCIALAAKTAGLWGAGYVRCVAHSLYRCF